MRSASGIAAVAAACAALVTPTAPADAAPRAAEGGTFSCRLPYPAIWIRVAGHVQSGWRDFVTRLERGPAAAIVWTRGVRLRTGTVVLGGVTRRSREIAPGACAPISPLAPGSTASLRKPVRMKSGWYADREFMCNVRGRVIVHVHPIRRNGAQIGNYLSVRTASGTMLAVAQATRVAASLRVARRCPAQ